jgi:hypothetical protein
LRTISKGTHAAFSASNDLIVTGLCVTSLNGKYEHQGITLDGRGFYKNGAGKYLYYDAACDGKGSSSPRWIFDNSKPSTTNATDLDGDGMCFFHVYIDSASIAPPTGANTWWMYCDGKWTYGTIQITFDFDVNFDPSRCTCVEADAWCTTESGT